MKLLFLIFLALIVSAAVYILSSKWLVPAKKSKKFNRKPLIISATVLIFLLGLIAFGELISNLQPDMQCTSSHSVSYRPPSTLKTANDYFLLGNYDYDTGNCKQAVTDYTKAITLNPNFTRAYNNRAYTNMRTKNYQAALPDLDKAVQLDPNYIQALMNRGDIHNYYYQIDRQSSIIDYKKVISLTGPSGGDTSVCGHLLLAEHNGWNIGTFLDFFRGKFAACN